MITPAVASAVSQFYALGNTPAVNLTRDLPQGVDADVLLLGCGDVRNILYTAYANTGLASRKFDVTSCDYDEAIIARNIVLLSLIIDHSEKHASHGLLWAANYHIYLSAADAKALCDQAEKLLSTSKNLVQWNQSKYGALLPITDAATLDDVRKIWQMYIDANNETTRQASITACKKSLNDSLAVRANRAGGTTQQPGQILTGIRSAAPLTFQAVLEVPDVNVHFWKTGVTGAESETVPNRLITACLSEHKLLHYGTDPLLGFHLATAFTPLAESSPLSFDAAREKYKSVAAAKAQFSAWVDATSALFRSRKLVVRSVVADVFAFCHTLQHLACNGTGSASWYKRQFDHRPLELDVATGLPTSFNVIDTSNIADHFGALNLLTSALPLLSADPYATLATETLLKNGPEDGAKHVLDRMLCGHGPSVALMLGVNLVDYWTNCTVESKVGEIVVGAKQAGSGISQLQIRASWKHANAVAERQSSVKMEPNHVASVLFQVYLNMFQHEDTTSMMTGAMRGLGFDASLPSGYTHFHRGSFVNLLKFVKGRFPRLDFGQVYAALDGMIASDRSLQFSSQNAQEFGAQLHLQKLISPPWLRAALIRAPQLGGFNAWKSVPEVVAVTLVVPRHHLDRLYKQSPTSNLAAPCFVGSLVSSQGHNMFGDVQLIFGTVSSTGSRTSEDFSAIIKADPAGWSGKSPLVASFYVPTAALQVEPKTAGVALDVLSTTQSILMFGKVLGDDMRVYKAGLSDDQHVFVTKYMPGQHVYPVYCAAASTEEAEDRHDNPSESKTTFTADVDKDGKITVMTGHLDILSEKGRRLLTDKVPINLRQSSPFTVEIVFADEDLVLPLHFPFPVDVKPAKTRIARKSAFCEVIVPFANPLETPALSDYVYPSVLATHLGELMPATLNAPHVSLDSLPVLDLENKSAISWVTTLTSFQFSAREKRLREVSTEGENWQSRSPRLNFKESLFSMFMLGTGLQGGQTGLFAINHPDRGGIHMLILASAFRLDAAAGSIVIDAAVLPLTLDLVTSGELTDFLYFIRTLEICSLTVDDAELVMWKKALPALAERARTWSHKDTCEYAATKKIPLSIEPNEPVLCSCGHGQLPKNFISLPEWETASQYATRIALSPTFAVPLVEDIIDTKSLLGGLETKDRCANCGATEAKGGGLLRRCRACMKVMYCGMECQKKDWKKHRGECQEHQ